MTKRITQAQQDEAYDHGYRNMFDRLEALIDVNGLTDVMEALAHICHEKADHLRENWQDYDSAKTWDYDAKMIEKAAGKLAN